MFLRNFQHLRVSNIVQLEQQRSLTERPLILRLKQSARREMN